MDKIAQLKADAKVDVERIKEKLRAKIADEKKILRKQAAAAQNAKRKTETRCKILAGTWVIESARASSQARLKFAARVKQLEREDDRLAMAELMAGWPVLPA